jgi:hypothetical protein
MLWGETVEDPSVTATARDDRARERPLFEVHGNSRLELSRWQ